MLQFFYIPKIWLFLNCFHLKNENEIDNAIKLSAKIFLSHRKKWHDNNKITLDIFFKFNFII